MTTARDEWLRLRERKRAAVSWSAALGLYLVIFLMLIALSSLATVELADYSGPIIVRLGVPEGADVPTPPPVPETPITPALPDTPVAPAPKTTPATPKPVPVAPKPETPVERVAAAPPAPAPLVLRGSENGNSYDMTFESSAGVAGRSMYVPIVLFMPLPFELDDAVYAAIPDLAGLPGTAPERRLAFERFYEKKPAGTWQLKRLKQPDYDDRPELWTMLEDAGYSLKNAEYKEGKHLRPVEILFKVSTAATGRTPVLEDVLLESSSGYSDIDAAVLYGFRRAEFSNSGTKSISGRFTYRF
ncbi:MAG: hypothetical protein JXM71_08060 [Spirochaetales bacterium]|nr:hypothetical protein [Spirochaetales bacterium]